MLLDFKQIDNVISLSWWDASGSVRTLDLLIDDDDMHNWVTCGPNDPERSLTLKNWDGKCVKPTDKVKTKNGKKKYPKLTDFRIAEIIDDLKCTEDGKRLYDEIFEYSVPRMVFIDIEVDVDDDFPDPAKAERAVTCIGIATQKHDVVVLGTRPLNEMEVSKIQKDVDKHCEAFGSRFRFIYKSFDSECSMLTAFLKLVKNVPMMSGWNFVWFDWFYIQNRCEKLGINLALASPRGMLTDYARENKNVCKTPLHIGIIDYMNAYDKWSTNAKENLKLDQAGYDILGLRKVHYEGSLKDLYHNDFQRYIFYNAIDCILVEMLHEKLGVSNIGCTIANLAKMRSTKMFSSIALTESVLARDYYEQGRVLAKRGKSKEEDAEDKYEGAYVKAPIVGYHRCCICNDFASLYPNIIRELNLSPETLVTKIDENDDVMREKWLKKGFIVARSGCVFRPEPGVFPTLVGRIYNKRKEDKKLSYIASDKAFRLTETIEDKMLSAEEILKKCADIIGEDVTLEQAKQYIAKYEYEKDKYHNFEQGEKRMINSFYGGLGNSHMYFYNRDLAECVTKQGKDAILYAERNINDYFLNHWHEDVETHRRLGVKVNGKVNNAVSVYIDTDSVYSQLDEVIRTTDWCIGDSKSNWQMSVVKNGKKEVHWYCGARSEEETRAYFDNEGFVDYELTRVKGEAKDFALAIDDVVLADFFKRIFEEYAKKLNTKNYLVFELETYSDAGIWLAKKKYIQNIRWTDDLPKDEIREKYSAIKAKGIEMIQPSSPAFARKKIKEAVRWIFSHDNFTMDEFVTWLDGVRKEFELANIEDICWNKKCTGYSQYVVNDTDKIEVRTKTPANVKAIALYNFLLNNKPQFKGKYNMMRGGEKCKIYYCLPTREAGKDYDMFAFEPGIRPDFAPAVDKRTMFEKSIIDPINRILGVLPNATEVTYDMMLMKTLF